MIAKDNLILQEPHIGGSGSNHGAGGNHGGSQSVGVVLFQLGGPDSPEAIEPFLYNLFSDPDIIDFPFARLARTTLARLISSRRAGHVREHYARIGGRSPIRELTERQAAALERELRKTMDARCFVAMRYWNPSTADVIRQTQVHHFPQLVLLPLYPQYSKTTTGSSLNEWRRQYSAVPGRSEVRVISDFHMHPLYLEALVENINVGLEKFRLPGELTDIDEHLVFSAHGLPLKEIERGDPYQTQIEETTRLVMERGRWPNPHCLCYQSRVGPGKWLEPSLEATLSRLASQGAQRVMVIPISFVTDHVETLHEIGIEAREWAQKLGFRQFEVMPAPPSFGRSPTSSARPWWLTRQTQAERPALDAGPAAGRKIPTSAAHRELRRRFLLLRGSTAIVLDASVHSRPSRVRTEAAQEEYSRTLSTRQHRTRWCRRTAGVHAQGGGSYRARARHREQ